MLKSTNKSIFFNNNKFKKFMKLNLIKINKINAKYYSLLKLSTAKTNNIFLRIIINKK